MLLEGVLEVDRDAVSEEHRIPAAVAGFTPESLLAAMYSVLRQVIEQRPFLDNCYPQLVRPGGNPTARQTLDAVMDVVDANWRGIGVIPDSGFAPREEEEPCAILFTSGSTGVPIGVVKT